MLVWDKTYRNRWYSISCYMYIYIIMLEIIHMFSGHLFERNLKKSKTTFSNKTLGNFQQNKRKFVKRKSYKLSPGALNTSPITKSWFDWEYSHCGIQNVKKINFKSLFWKTRKRDVSSRINVKHNINSCTIRYKLFRNHLKYLNT